MYPLSATSFPKIFSVNFLFSAGYDSSRIGWGQLPLDDFSAVVDNDVQFETEEPPHSPFATCGKSPKGFVSSRSLVVTHPNGGGVNDRDAGAIAQTTVVEKQIKFERNHLLTFHKAIVREHDGKVLSPLFADHWV